MDEKERTEHVRRAVEGDGDALQRLIVEYHGSLRGTIAGRMDAALRRHVSPNDILQQAYAAAFKSVRRCSFESPGAFYKWLEKIALDQLYNTGRDLMRGRRDIRRNLSRSPGGRTPASDLVKRLPSPLSTPSRHLARREASAAAISSLARLTDDQREVVQMRFLENRSVAEIAAELGKSEGAVHMLIKRALDKLAELLGSISKYLSKT
ncbi:MAG: sigma-70 family RNA polymerase sigma factor [Phycisphaerae bacterium]|nr:sigma-70 family RNA polymerase sigma factor [Phycisphaerae bacterium]